MQVFQEVVGPSQMFSTMNSTGRDAAVNMCPVASERHLPSANSNICLGVKLGAHLSWCQTEYGL